MNFQYIKPVRRGKDYLDEAFRKAREKSNKTLKGNWLQIIRQKEMIKMDVVKSQLVEKLDKVVKDFPSLDNLPVFYHKLLKLTLDYGELKNALGGVSWAIGKVRYLHKDYVRKVAKFKEGRQVSSLTKEFYGRISSILKQIDKQLVVLEASRRVMKSYPDIKELPTVCVYGFPNVGKTTLLNKLTGAKAEVASYSFTTKGINAGFFGTGDEKKQILDVPGTLARVDKMNDIERIAHLVVKELAAVVVYVFDLSGAVALKKQMDLYKQLKKSYKGKILIYLSKLDLIDEVVVDEFRKEHKLKVFDLKGLKGELRKLK